MSKKKLEEEIPYLSKADRVSLSVYDIIKMNMAKAHRVAFLIQVAYIGCFRQSLGHMTVYQLISDDVDMHNENDSAVTGLLLMHNNCFINKITCSQDTAYEHFKKLLLSGQVSNMKILHYYPHTRQRQFRNWYMLYVTPLLTKEGDKKPVTTAGDTRDGNPAEGNSAISQGPSAENAPETMPDDPAGAVLDVFKMFNDLSAHLEMKSNGYLQVSVTERLAREVSHLIPSSDQIRFSCYQSCLRDMTELLEDYHQIRHPKFYTDEIWPIPSNSGVNWSSPPTDEAMSQQEDEDNQSGNE